MSAAGEESLRPSERRAVVEFLLLRELDEAGDDPAALAPGDDVAGFTLVRELGRGGMGVVWLARQRALGRDVALKLLPRSALDDAAHVVRVEREARMLASLRHPAIVAVHAAGALPGLRYVAMEHVDGTTLRELLRGRAPGTPRPCEEGWRALVLPMLERVAQALAAAHAAGIVHRDVKPDNVLVDRAGRAFLADFGLARTRSGSDATRTRGFVGTPRYASPEQLEGAPLEPASDVFSFGATAFEALTGRPPFPQPEGSALEQAIRYADPRWSPRDRLPRELRAVVERCMEKRAADRYQDGAALAEDLGRFLRFEPVRAVPRGPLARAWRRTLLRPGPALARLGVAALLLAVAALALRSTLQQDSFERLEANTRLERAVTALRGGRWDAARGSVAPLLEFATAPPSALRAAGDAWLWQGEPGRAAELYGRLARSGAATEVDRMAWWLAGAPLDPPADAALRPRAEDGWRELLVRGSCRARRGDPEGALAAYDAALERDPGSYPLRLARSDLLVALGRREQALADLRVQRELRPDDAGIARATARLLSELERPREAEDLLRGALAAQPDQALLLAELARRVGEDGARAEEALALARRAQRLETRHPFVLATLAQALAWSGRLAEGRRLLELALTELPLPELRLALARLELHAGEVARAAALADFREGLQGTLALEALDLRARIAEAAGERAAAGDALRALAARDPQRPAWWARLATWALAGGEGRAAADHAERALELAPQAARLHALLGRALAAAGDEEEALLAFRRARERDAELVEAWRGEAEVRLNARDERLRDAAEAGRLLERALALAPQDEELLALRSAARRAQ